MKKLMLLFAVALSINAAAQIPSYIPANGLVGWWPFNGNANDESGNGNDGTVYSAVLCPDRFNQPSSAYYFGGNNQQIRCSNDTMLTNHNELTASAWFNVKNRPSGWDQNVIISNIGTWNASGGFELLTGNPTATYIAGMFRNPTYQDQPLSTNTLISIDSSIWYHVVYTLHYNSGIDSTLSSIYINGNLITEQYFPLAISWSAITPFMIGVNIDSIGWQRAFKGMIDDVGIWNRALSPSEIQTMYGGCNLVLTIQPTDESVIEGNDVQFTTSANNTAALFQWQSDNGSGFTDLSNGGQYSGVNNDTLTVIGATTSNDNESFRCIVSAGSCADTSGSALLNVQPNSIDELSSENDFNIYPIPADEIIQIHLGALNNNLTTLSIYNQLGQLVKTKAELNGNLIIDVSALPDGFYFIKLNDDKSFIRIEKVAVIHK